MSVLLSFLCYIWCFVYICECVERKNKELKIKLKKKKKVQVWAVLIWSKNDINFIYLSNLNLGKACSINRHERTPFVVWTPSNYVMVKLWPMIISTLLPWLPLLGRDIIWKKIMFTLFCLVKNNVYLTVRVAGRAKN